MNCKLSRSGRLVVWCALVALLAGCGRLHLELLSTSLATCRRQQRRERDNAGGHRADERSSARRRGVSSDVAQLVCVRLLVR